MPADARVSAWLSAWRQIESADNILRQLHTPRGLEEIAPGALHECLTAQADVLTRLACAPEDVGLAAGEVLQQEHIAQQKQEEFRDLLREKIRGR